MQRLPKLNIIHEDRDILVVAKPPGLLTSTVPREPRPTLLAMVREYMQIKSPDAQVGLIHRLDKDAGGLLVFSKNNPAYQSLKSQFFHHTVTRVYTAIVEGRLSPPKGTIRSRLIERADGTVYSTRKHAAGQTAETDYEVLSKDKARMIVKVTLQTGRKHQVRVHLSERGAPIVGDPMYGKKHPMGMHLAATSLALDHPRTGNRMEFRLPPPPWLG
jgi:RluA family pseudouridine synthase